MTLKRSVAFLPFVLVALALLVFAACGDDDGDTDTPSDTSTEEPSGSHSQVLQDVVDRGRLNCGVNDSVPGFGNLLADGTFAGFDIDYCKAVAAAVLGDPELVDYTPLTAEARLTAVQTGQVDVLIRNTTWTTGRDASSGLTFATTSYYDGQGMMVRANSGFTSVDDLATAAICVLQGTTTELNLLYSTIISNRDTVCPGWYWFRDNESEDTVASLIGLSIGSPNPRIQERAIQILELAKIPRSLIRT